MEQTTGCALVTSQPHNKHSMEKADKTDNFSKSESPCAAGVFRLCFSVVHNLLIFFNAPASIENTLYAHHRQCSRRLFVQPPLPRTAF